MRKVTRRPGDVALLIAFLLVACGPSPDGEVRTTVEDAATERETPSSADAQPAAQAPSPVVADSLELMITLDDAACVPGECVCRGTAERSAGLWRIGLETRELSGGVHCVAADFDENGHTDFALLGGEGWVAVAMYALGGPIAVVEVDAGGYPGLYQPRGEEGSGGEPVARTHGLFVPNVGGDHAVFLWDGATFVRTLYPAS